MTAYGRTWKEHHIAAGYHEQDWGPVPAADSELIGTYQGTEQVTVRLVNEGESGAPELEIEWENGSRVTVLNEETALMYLAQVGAVTVVE